MSIGSAGWSRAVWRTALQPRWLGLLGVVLVLCVVFGGLGRWQLGVAESKGQHRPGNTQPLTALDAVVAPQQVFRTDMVGRPVTVAGAYDAGRQVLVAGKSEPGHAGDHGFWVVTALRTASGADVPVVRGWVPSATAPAPPTGPVTVVGSLQPAETTSTDPSAATLPAGQISAADTATLVNSWSGPIYNVLVYATSVSPPLDAVPIPPPDTGGGLKLRNAAYAVQWWLFGAFALLLWWRMVRQEAIDAAAAAAVGEPTSTEATPTEMKPTEMKPTEATPAPEPTEMDKELSAP